MIKTLFSLEPNAGAVTVLGDENHTGRFERGDHLGSSFLSAADFTVFCL